MNKEDYVSLEVAKLLKGKGYDEDCNILVVEECWSFNKGKLTCVDKDREFCPFPTLYEASKWLRNKHQLHIDVGMCGDYSTDADGNKVDEWDFWTFDMYYTTNFTNHIYDCKGKYDTYEEALNAGILEALKLI